ncbi:hypothetical protein HUG10_20570 (plasmid) [Halorarum halophilum]|uniref:Uncharacterized protein n=1 Tax=Halorarum halophilum TaxID=2743090 RepID=A0A7D5L334_9EURY|nr:hypothetical protein [Halobaculum halophilum]QLG30003.1 hypothetical protein HUG10_20570 [Halobaculum halophilum]
MKVDVYQNLHMDCLSVRSREPYERYGRVIAHVDEIVLRDVDFVVQPAGRERVRDEGRKNVHAFARGNWFDEADRDDAFIEGEPTRFVVYNPYVYNHFVFSGTKRPIESADVCYIAPGAVEVPAAASPI